MHQPTLAFSCPSAAILQVAARFVLLLLLPVLIYMLSFVVHFLVLPHYGPGGSFHGQDFTCRLLAPPGLNASDLAYLYNHNHCRWSGCHSCASVEPLGMWGAIVALNRRMLSANAHVTNKHAFGSRFLDWPFNSQPVFYWNLVRSGSL